MPRPTKKNQIIEAAFKLFGENGFYATGVDLIMQTARVSKRTLYNHFSTKNDLIVAVLIHYREGYKERLDKILEQGTKTSREKIIAIFDDAKLWFDDPNFHGCLAVNAMGEFSGKNRDIETSCQSFKRWELQILRDLAKDTGVLNPDDLAYKLFILLEGMASIAQVTKGKFPVDMSEMAKDLIDQRI